LARSEAGLARTAPVGLAHALVGLARVAQNKLSRAELRLVRHEARAHLHS
jgi:hypothetical protein